MPKLYVLSQGTPWDTQQPPLAYKGLVKIGDNLGQWAFYQISGTAAQLTAINALAQVVGLVVVTEAGMNFRPELGVVISSPDRTKINAWLTARGLTNIPAGWTYGQLVQAILARFSPSDLAGFNVVDG